MNQKLLLRLFIISLVLALLSGQAVSLLKLTSVKEVHAAVPNINMITGLFRSLAAINKRNQVYAEARATTTEINAYYDAQIATAQRIRKEQISAVSAGEKSSTFIRSYLRAEAALEQERKAMLQAVEAEKNRARQDFNRALANEIKNLLLASPGSQSIITDIRSTIYNTREAAAALQAAVNAASPTELLTTALTNQIGDSRVAQQLAQSLGSQIGSQINRSLDGPIRKLEQSLTQFSGELGQAITQLDQLEASVAQQQEQVRSPVSLTGNRQPNRTTTAINPNSVGLDVAAFAFTIATERSGNMSPGETRQSMYDQIRSSLQSAILSGIMTTLQGGQPGELFCLVTSRAEYLTAASTLGLDTQEPQNPAEAKYLVCYDVTTNEPKIARVLESKFTAETETASEEEGEETEAEEVATPQITSDIASCLVDPGDFSYGFADLEQKNCTDPARCTGCIGIFYVQNESSQTINIYDYYYNNFLIPTDEGWHDWYTPLQPGERWEEHISVDNRWKQGIYYRNRIVKILVIKNTPECAGFSTAQMDTYAILIDPIPCE